MAASSGKYYSDVKQGNVFIGNTAVAGTAFPISTATAMTFGLWNVNPNKNAVLISLNLSYTSGTIALGEVGLTNIAGAFSVATGGNITAFTDGVINTTIKNALIGSGGVPTMRFTPSAATVVAGTACYWTGNGFAAVPGTPADGQNITFNHDFDGRVIVTPGNAVFVVGSVAQTGVFTMSLMWAEVPV